MYNWRNNNNNNYCWNSIDHNHICGLWKRYWLNVQHQIFATIISRKQFDLKGRWLHLQKDTMTDMTVGRLTQNKAFHINFSTTKMSFRRKYWTMAHFTLIHFEYRKYEFHLHSTQKEKKKKEKKEKNECVENISFLWLGTAWLNALGQHQFK